MSDILKHILFEGAPVKKYPGKEYFDKKKNEMRLYYKKEGIDGDGPESLRSCSIDRLADNRYFYNVLEDKGPAAQFAWENLKRFKSDSPTIDGRKTFIKANSWYHNSTLFRLTDRETHNTGKAMIRISSHEPEMKHWSEKSGSSFIWCLNIMIGKDITDPKMKVFPDTVNLRFNTKEEADSYENGILKDFLKDIRNGNNGTITGAYNFSERYFALPIIKDKISKKINNNSDDKVSKLESGFTKSELRSLPKAYDADRIQNYYKVYYTEPSGNIALIYYNNNGGFYFKNKFKTSVKDRKPLTILENMQINEAVQILPILNVDTQEYVIGELFSEDVLFGVGLKAFTDGIDQVDLKKWNDFLELITVKFKKNYTYELKKYKCNIWNWIEELNEKGDDRPKKAVIELGRQMMQDMLKRLNFNDKGELRVYKAYDIRDLAQERYFTFEWNCWNFDEIPENIEDYAFIAVGVLDISQVDWMETALNMIHYPDEKTVYVNSNPKVEIVKLADGKEFLI